MEVLRGNFVAFTHPVHTQKQLFGILGHVSTMIMLGTSDKKNTPFGTFKKKKRCYIAYQTTYIRGYMYLKYIYSSI